MQPTDLPGSSLARWRGLWQPLGEELRPYPGRTATVARMLLAATIVMLLVMALRLQFAFLGVFNALLISRQSPRWLLRNGPLVLLANAAGLLYVMAGLSLLSSYPVAYLLFLALSFYLAFFLKAVLSSNYVAFGFGVLVAVLTTFLWYQPGSAGERVQAMVSLAAALMLGTLVPMAIASAAQWVGSERPSDAIQPAGGSLMVPDAFSNADYRRFALRGCLGGSLCVVLDSAAAWPVMMAACAATCMSCMTPGRPAALQSAANWRFGLRTLGLLVGGVLLGMGSQALLLPLMDSIAAFTAQFVVLAALAAWFSTAGPRLSPAGPLMAMGYLFTMLERFGPSQSLGRSRDVIVDMFISVVVNWLIIERGRGHCAPAAGGG